MALPIEEARSRLAAHGQEHVLAFWDRLGEAQRADLLAQVEALDFDGLTHMREMLGQRDDSAPAAFDPRTGPAPVACPDAAEAAAARQDGDALLRAGEVGVILVAGGQGSRLGFDGPKGAFPVGPISGATLFEIHARKILRLEQKYGTEIPFYIMTSEANDRPTREFFVEHGYFGLEPGRVHFFVQGMWPALWPDGRIVMESPSAMFRNPDGHGGTLAALQRNGMIDDMTRRGLSTLFYFQVDNPLVEIADPAFLGLHARANADISLKVCAKRDATEGLGVAAELDGRRMIIEYIDLPPDQQAAVGPDGQLKFLYGSVAIHVFSLPFLRREAAARLPLHVAHKKVPYCDEAGVTIKPDAPNAFKFEKFIFDVLPDAGTVLNVAFDRAEEFSPVKNAEGADSPATTQRDMMRKFARWLNACGVGVPADAEGTPTVKLEIDPVYAIGPDDLKEKLPRGFRVTGDTLLT